MRSAAAAIVTLLGAAGCGPGSITTPQGHADGGGADDRDGPAPIDVDAPGALDVDARPSPDARPAADARPTFDARVLPPDAIRIDASWEGCSGHGTGRVVGTDTICVCDPGYTAGDALGHSCTPTADVCRGGPIDYDVDGDGTNEDWFEPSASECEMYELINRTRAEHDAEGTPECHTPLAYDLLWSAHARNHSKAQYEAGDLFHADAPGGQNCAYGCGPACEMDMYMNGSNEGHCPPLSHHCNIMRCSFSAVGVGYWPLPDGTWNTQNFY